MSDRSHWRQPRRGCRGHIPQYFGWGDVNGNISPNIITYFRKYSRPILVALRSLSLKPISFGYKTPPIRFSQAGGQGSSVVPPTLNSRLCHCPPRLFLRRPPPQPFLSLGYKTCSRHIEAGAQTVRTPNLPFPAIISPSLGSDARQGRSCYQCCEC